MLVTINGLNVHLSKQNNNVDNQTRKKKKSTNFFPSTLTDRNNY